MRVLHHHPLSPESRLIRLALGEKHLDTEYHEEAYWLRSEDFLTLNPAGEVPVLVDEDDVIVTDCHAICEYLEEVYSEVPLGGKTVSAKAETRRLIGWFNGKFEREVTRFISGEKLFKRIAANGTPDSRALRAGRENIHGHLEYIAWLTDRRSWLAGDTLSYADLAAAAHISLIDYTGDVPWNDHPLTKEWYVRIKSRPSFRILLKDVLPHIPPAPVYADLDF